MARSNVRQFLRQQRQIARAKEKGYIIPTKLTENANVIPDLKELAARIRNKDIGYIIYGR